MRRLIMADGSTTDLSNPQTAGQIARLIGASTLDTVQMRHMGQPVHVMFVDDQGHEKGRPANAEATRLYHANCRPGTTHQIVGDVFLCPDSDFEKLT